MMCFSKLVTMAPLAIIAVVVCLSTAVFAQKTALDSLREIEARNRAAQLELKQSRLKWQQVQSDFVNRNAELERSRAETDRVINWIETQKTEKRLRELAERAEQTANDQAEAARKAEEAAEELRDEIERNAIRTRNHLYVGMMLLLVIGFVTYVIRKSNREQNMDEHQKFGVVTIIVSALLTLFALMISDDWVQKFDLLQNLMLSLRIKFFDYTEGYNTLYYIDLPTRYVVLACLCAAAYGLTTYLRITLVPWKKKQEAKDAKDAAPEIPQ